MNTGKQILTTCYVVVGEISVSNNDFKQEHLTAGIEQPSETAQQNHRSLCADKKKRKTCYVDDTV